MQTEAHFMPWLGLKGLKETVFLLSAQPAIHFSSAFGCHFCCFGVIGIVSQKTFLCVNSSFIQFLFAL